MPDTVKDKIVAALEAAPTGLTVDEVCKQVYRRVGARERNTVAVALYRLVEAGWAKKREATWIKSAN